MTSRQKRRRAGNEEAVLKHGVGMVHANQSRIVQSTQDFHVHVRLKPEDLLQVVSFFLRMLRTSYALSPAQTASRLSITECLVVSRTLSRVVAV